MFDDEKIKLIEALPGADTILIIWVKLLCLAGKTNASGYIYLAERMPYSDEMLATLLCRPINTVRLALTTFERFRMIEINQEGIYLLNWQKHQSIDKLEQIREQNKLRQAAARQRKMLPAGNGTSNASRVTVT
jgi:predicted phage replisome organizer